MVLAKIEDVSGRPAASLFDFVAGTSTGALIAAAIAAGVPAKQIVDIYCNRTKEVFRPTGAESDILFLTRSYRFGVERLYKLVHQILGSYADMALNDLPIDIMLTAKSEDDGWPWYFVRDNPGNAGTTGHLPLAACATASGAAPTYFDSYTLPDGRHMVDGGLGVVGNPVLQSCIEAFRFGNGKYTPEDTIVVSLGTGKSPRPTRPTGDIISKVQWVLDVSLDAPSHQQVEILGLLYGERLRGFHVIDIPLVEHIDLADLDAIPTLLKYGAELASQIDVSALLQL